MYFTYKDFKLVNDKVKKAYINYKKDSEKTKTLWKPTLDNENHHIAKVDFKKDVCVIANGQQVAIATLVESIIRANYYVLNPSAISKWCGFVTDELEPNPRAKDIPVEDYIYRQLSKKQLTNEYVPDPEKYQGNS